MYIALAFLILISISIVILAVLFPRLPRFYLKDKLPVSGVVRRLELDNIVKKCAKYKLCPRLLELKFKLLFSRIQKNGAVKAPSISDLISVKDRIANRIVALKKDVKCLRKHKNISRMFVFCDETISFARCDISDELFEKCAVTYFGRVTESDKNALRMLLDYCLMCTVLQTAGTVERAALSYLRGISDGKRVNADINSVRDTAYICGLYEGANDIERGSIDKLLEINGGSVRDYAEEYAFDTAQAYVDIACGLRSLSEPICIERSSDVTYFGDDGYKINVLKNSELYLSTDNRGAVIAEYKRISHGIKLQAEIGGKKFDLRLCDGVMQPYRTVYRSVDSGAELAAEIIIPFDNSCVIMSVRTIGTGTVRLNAKLDIPNKSVVNDSVIGIVAEGSYAAGLCAVCEKPVRYLGSEFGLSAVSEFFATPFKADRALFVFAFSESSVSVERIFDMVKYFDYFDIALRGAKVYYDRIATYETPVLPQSSGMCKCPEDGDYPERLFLHNVPTYEYCDAEQCEYELQTACGGFMSDGSYSACVSEFDGGTSYSAALSEIMGDRLLSVSVALERDGKIVLPFARAAVSVKFGYVELSSRYSGDIYTMKTYKESRDIEIYDITIDCDGCRNVMLYFEPQNADISEAVRNDGKIIMSTSSEQKLCVTCSHDISEFTPYKEGYSDHGMLNRTSGFGAYGICVRPAISVNVNAYNNRIVLCVERFADIPKIKTANISYADELLNSRMQVFAHAIKPLTFDKKLNFCYSRALEAAQAGFTENELDCSCFAEKYVDPLSVRHRLTELFKRQSTDGNPHCADPLYAALVIPILTDEYVKRSGDEGFWCAEIPFCDGTASERTVLSHCLRAIRYCSSADDIFSANLLFCAIMRIINKFRPTVRKKLTAYAAALKSKIDNYVSQITVCKIREHAESFIITALCSSNKKRSAELLDHVRTFCAAFNGSFAEVFGIDIALLYGFAEYGAQRYDKGYGIIREATEYFMSGTDTCGVPRIVRRDDHAHAAALYYMLVTEKLFGISIKRDGVKLDPCVSSRTPHIEYELVGKRGTRHIVVDDGEGKGSWRLRMGRITCASNVIGDGEHAEFTLFKSDSA